MELLWQGIDRKRNLLAEEAPGFVDEGGGDLSPRVGSALIDAGDFLTRTRTAGEGVELTVADAAFFFDGAGVPGVPGDEIQLEGGQAKARVVAVDLAQGVLRLDHPLQWRQGQGVALVFRGEAPDMGAYEVIVP